MIEGRFRKARRLAPAFALALPILAFADPTPALAAAGTTPLAVPSLGPFGVAFLGLGVAGAGLLISRGRRKSDDD
jgi:hypothetical protein